MKRVAVRVRAERAEEAFDVLLPLLPAGVHERDVRFGSVELVALCEPAEAVAVAGALGDLALAPPRVEEAADLATELDRLRPVVEVGRVVVRPASAPPPGDDRVDVVMASRRFGFGTGAHPTTRLCLELLQGLSTSSPHDRSTRQAPGEAGFADLGCGAGAVLVAAAKLGWSPVVGADHSALALRDAEANVAANRVEAELLALDLLRDDLPEGVATAVVNVDDARVHARLAGAPFATLIASGLRRREIDAALRRYEAGGFAVAGRGEEGEWAAAVLRRPSATRTSSTRPGPPAARRPR